MDGSQAVHCDFRIFGYYAAKDVHRDHSFFVGSTYSLTRPWILEEGIRFKSCCSDAGKLRRHAFRDQRTVCDLLDPRSYPLIRFVLSL
jgi:hypothetical protein